MDSDSEGQKDGYEAVKHLSDEELEAQKQAALDACINEHHAYLKCIEKGGLNLLSSGFCWEDNAKFWKCYKEQRGFLAWKFRRVIESSNELALNYGNKGKKREVKSDA